MELHVRTLGLSLVDFALANKLSTRADATQHLVSAHGWQAASAALFIIEVEKWALAAGKIATANWSSLRNAWNLDGEAVAKRWVRHFLDVDDFAQQPDVQRPLLTMKRAAVNDRLAEQNHLIGVVDNMLAKAASADETAVLTIARQSISGTRSIFLRARDSIDAKLSNL